MNEARVTEQCLRRELSSLHASLDGTTADLAAAETVLAENRDRKRSTDAYKQKTDKKINDLEV